MRSTPSSSSLTSSTSGSRSRTWTQRFRITAMVDCLFEQHSEIPNSKTEDPRPKALVSLGDNFALASGLMEIALTHLLGALI